MKKLAILGCGSLSRTFCRHAMKHLGDDYFISSVCARDHSHAVELASQIGGFAAHNVEQMLATQPDYVLEFAGIEAVEEYAQTILESGADLVISSVGALDDEKFREHLVRVATHEGRHIYVSNGAVGGLDIMETFAVTGNPEVEINSVRSPESYEESVFVRTYHPDLSKEQVLYKGTVSEAVNLFPRRINVAVATALATETPEAKLTLISKPGTSEHTHKITLKNDLMHAEMSFSSKPDPESHRSSLSSAFSMIALLKNLAAPLSFF